MVYEDKAIQRHRIDVNAAMGVGLKIPSSTPHLDRARVKIRDKLDRDPFQSV